MDQPRCISFRVTGRVQGVFFRKYTQKSAVEAGVVGHVQNEDDGAVTGLGQGSRAALQQFEAFLHRGSPRAQVDAVQVVPHDPITTETFNIRR